jgi:hypothetical protein
MFGCSARRPGKRGVNLKKALARFALASRHLNFQIDRMKANRQGLHTTDSFAFANHISAAAAGANIEFVQRLNRHHHAAVFDLRPRGPVTLGYTENLVQ